MGGRTWKYWASSGPVSYRTTGCIAAYQETSENKMAVPIFFRPQCRLSSMSRPLVKTNLLVRIKRASQSYALLLTPGQVYSFFADFRVVASR